MGEEDMEDAARSNVRTGELDLRKMEADSILTLGESSTASAGLLTPRKSLEMEAQLLRGRIRRIRLQYRIYQIKVGSNIITRKYDESRTVSAMDYVAQNIERRIRCGTYDKSGMADRVQ